MLEALPEGAGNSVIGSLANGLDVQFHPVGLGRQTYAWELANAAFTAVSRAISRRGDVVAGCGS